MNSFPLSVLFGLATGFFGAIPPGPLNVTIIRKASHGLVRDAFRVALGGALVDILICACIGLGFGWALQPLVTNRWIKLGLACFLLAYGLKILLRDAKRDAKLLENGMENGAGANGPAAPAPRGRIQSFFVGLLQGAANPTLYVNWTFVIGFLAGHGLIHLNAANASGFAVGVGLGVFGWFALLIELLDRLRDHPVGAWLRRSTALAGILLVLFGLYFTVRSVTQL